MQVVCIAVIEGDTDGPWWKLPVGFCPRQVLKRNWIGDRSEHLHLRGKVCGTDTESPWVYIGFGHAMVDQDDRLLVEDGAQTIKAPCRLLEGASERNVLRNVDFTFPSAR